MSTPLTMDKMDWKKILKGALIAAAGAGLLYLIEFVGGLNFGIFQTAIAALLSVLVNIVRKFVTNNK